MTAWFVWMKILSLFMTSYCSLNSTAKNPSLGVSGLSNEYYCVVPLFSLMFSAITASQLTSSSFSRLLHTELISQPEISLESRHFRRPEPHLMQETPALPPPSVRHLRGPSPTVRTTQTRPVDLQELQDLQASSSSTVGCSPATPGWAWLEVTTGTTTLLWPAS